MDAASAWSPPNKPDEEQPLTAPETPAKMSVKDVLYAYDLTLAQLIYQRFGRSKALRVLWEILSHTGDGILWFLMVLPVVAVLWLAGSLANVSQASKTVFLTFYICNFVDIVAIILMKVAFKRERPPHHQTDGRFVGPDAHSFPSGHSTRVWCLVALFYNLSADHEDVVRGFFHLSPTALCVLVTLWALVICFSRIALGRHYPSDVLAGSLIGFLIEFPIANYIIQSQVFRPVL